jgi:hypothetical protein
MSATPPRVDLDRMRFGRWIPNPKGSTPAPEAKPLLQFKHLDVAQSDWAISAVKLN